MSLIVACVLGGAGSASAQWHPIDAETHVEEHRIDGCSRSTASTSTESRLRLELTASGEATLELESTSHSSFRSMTYSPKRGIGSSGSRAGSHEKHTWTGRVSAGPGGEVLLTFDRVLTAEVDWTGYGSLPLPPPRAQQVHLVVSCTTAPIDVFPSTTSGQAAETAGPGETPTPIAGYVCRLSTGTAFMLQRLGEIPFAKDVPITRHVSAMWRGEQSLVRRR